MDTAREDFHGRPHNRHMSSALEQELVALHLLKSPLLAQSPAKYDQVGDDVVEAVRYDEAHGRVYINKQQYFSGIDRVLYEFQVGGYQVMNKWLRDRKGRKLSHEAPRTTRRWLRR